MNKNKLIKSFSSDPHPHSKLEIEDIVSVVYKIKLKHVTKNHVLSVEKIFQPFCTLKLIYLLPINY